MKATHEYQDNQNNEWVLGINDNNLIQVWCGHESRLYKINEPITGFMTEDDYVYIYVRHPEVKFYQFKFEADKFLVADVFDIEDQHIGEFACHVFCEN